jgi:lysophospholipase L1-like esterase
MMEFRLPFTPKVFEKKVKHQHQLLLIGSCFTENIGAKFKHLKFTVAENPHGILFNPISIATAIHDYLHQTMYTDADLVYHNESWHSWHHHSRFSHPNKSSCLQLINQSIAATHQFLQQANWVFITLGSAFVYQINNEHVVANCHKIPTDKFTKKLLTANEVTEALQQIVANIASCNPSANIIFTISPVRHLREGFIENNRSKATLIQAVHAITDVEKNCFYFPAYELVMDDLRDYRFFAEDMVHPNYAATNYVWQKLIAAALDEPTQLLINQIQQIVTAKNHKPFNAASTAHQQFLQTNLQKVMQLQQQYPYINFSEEVVVFSAK